jgi:hypothetical protein
MIYFANIINIEMNSILGHSRIIVNVAKIIISCNCKKEKNSRKTFYWVLYKKYNLPKS